MQQQNKLNKKIAKSVVLPTHRDDGVNSGRTLTPCNFHLRFPISPWLPAKLDVTPCRITAKSAWLYFPYKWGEHFDHFESMRLPAKIFRMEKCSQKPRKFFLYTKICPRLEKFVENPANDLRFLIICVYTTLSVVTITKKEVFVSSFLHLATYSFCWQPSRGSLAYSQCRHTLQSQRMLWREPKVLLFSGRGPYSRKRTSWGFFWGDI